MHEASGWPPQAVAESDGSSVPVVVLDTAREIAQEITDMWDRFDVNAQYHQRTDASAVRLARSFDPAFAQGKWNRIRPDAASEQFFTRTVFLWVGWNS